ncbi:MAG TPA: MFS transporter [Actinomycetes bacterium]|jgi:MFS family permease|nr:MFS transporter [Actinomycetes bacterium]
MASTSPAPAAAGLRRSAVRFVVLLGVLSLLADTTYEGARSITGPFLAMLGASGAVVGAVAGFGELVGYAVRLGSGRLSERTGRTWLLTIAGYAVNLLAVPLLALAGNWPAAATLMIAERIGKGVRVPPRDAMLSHAAAQLGRGWGFGLHEALDQVGAVLGPLLVALVVATHHGYRAGFVLLAVPAGLALAVVAAARTQYPNPRTFEADEQDGPTGTGLPRVFWLYLAASGLVAAGFADFPLIAFHFQQAGVVTGGAVPLFYAIAMGADALAALALGRLFDRVGIAAVIGAALAAAAFAPLVFYGRAPLAVVGLVLWGLGMASQESVMRAAVAAMTPPDRRASAYGIFNAGYGVCWFAGSVLLGVLYDRSLAALVGVSVAVQLAAVPLLLAVRGRLRPRSGQAARSGR